VNRLELGRRIRAARAYEALGRPELAERLDESVATVARWELGRDLPADEVERLELIRRVVLATEAPATFFAE